MAEKDAIIDDNTLIFKKLDNVSDKEKKKLLKYIYDKCFKISFAQLTLDAEEGDIYFNCHKLDYINLY